MNSDAENDGRLCRIAMLTPRWPPGVSCNGISSFVARMREVLLARGVGVAILSDELDGLEQDDVYDLRPHREPRGWRRLWTKLVWRLGPERTASIFQRHMSRGIVHGIRCAAQRGTVDLLQMEESFGWAGLVKQSCRTPVVVRLSGPWFLVGAADGSCNDARFRKRVELEGCGIALADGVIAPSRYTLDRVREYYRLPLEHATVIPNPAPVFGDTERWSLSECDRNTVLLVGRFDRLKGGDLMLRAFKKVLEVVAHARLCFVGPDRGLDEGGRHWGLSEYAQHVLPGAVDAGQLRYLGERSYCELPDLRRKALATVVCSRFENFANTLLEAVALGCPVVATRVGGLPEIVQDGRNGLLCEPENADSLAGRIIMLLKDHALAARLGRQAAMDCQERYCPDVVAKQMLGFYRSVIARLGTVDKR